MIGPYSLTFYEQKMCIQSPSKSNTQNSRLQSITQAPDLIMDKISTVCINGFLVHESY